MKSLYASFKLTNKDPSRTYHIKQASEFSQSVSQSARSLSQSINLLPRSLHRLGGHRVFATTEVNGRMYVPGNLDGSIPIDGDKVIDDALGARRRWRLPSSRAVRLRLQSGLWNEDHWPWPWFQWERIGVPLTLCERGGGSRR